MYILLVVLIVGGSNVLVFFLWLCITKLRIKQERNLKLSYHFDSNEYNADIDKGSKMLLRFCQTYDEAGLTSVQELQYWCGESERWKPIPYVLFNKKDYEEYMTDPAKI